MPSPPSPPNHPLLPPPDLFTRLTDPSSPLFFLALLALTAFGSLTARDFYLQLSFPLVVANLGSGFQAAGTILISIVGWQLCCA
ncbi:hypothetical protein BDY24DRAFT_412481 [Mrakia frigida]|uniref:uncharacterized protein n=1 Tax=Mrakia frigida TaxID=29902 RepID=UPI003FCBFE85